MTERIDKILSSELNISRKEAKSLIKSGVVLLNEKVIKSDSVKCTPEKDVLLCRGEKIVYKKFVYIMMNKPKGVISASDGKGEKTVIDILPNDMKRKNLFPAGRLDKDTTGFVLITDDGEFAHEILSPSNHIEKTYIASLSKEFDNEVKKAFEQGLTLGGKKLLESKIEPIGNDYTQALVVIKQGLYHQIKRMFARFSIDVVELKRIKMGNLLLDDSLDLGQCRYITEEELKLIADIH